MSRKTNNEKNVIITDVTMSASQFIKKNWGQIIAFVVTFLVAAAVTYLEASTTDTVATYAIEEYEIGQIADKTIFAPQSIAADEAFPIAIEEGEKVIRKGFAITEEDYLKLKKMAESPVYIDWRAFCDKILFLMLLSSLGFVLFSPVLLGRFPLFREILLECILFLIVISTAAFFAKTSFFQTSFSLPVIIPSTLCIFLIAILFGQISALYFIILLSLGVLCITDFNLIPCLFTATSGLAASRIVFNIQKRSDMVFASIFQAVLNCVFIVVLKIIFNDSFADAVFVLPGIAFNGFISGILALGLLTPLEIILNTASVFRLMDLSDVNAPLLRKLLVSASGTYQHSMQVAQLAEEACKKIGANYLLVRVASYYHDIGKIEHPEYFTENQPAGENKHDDINPSLSASILKNHVKVSVEKARHLRLPEQVIKIISEHHGNSVIEGFYAKAKEKDPTVSAEDFAYPENPPTSKESAVLMLADTVEAACRSLDEPSPARIEKFIQTLINAKVEKHQLDNCELNFNELSTIRDSFVEMQTAVYHSRVKYPNQKDPDGEKSDDVVLGDKTLSEANKV